MAKHDYIRGVYEFIESIPVLGSVASGVKSLVTGFMKEGKYSNKNLMALKEELIRVGLPTKYISKIDTMLSNITEKLANNAYSKSKQNKLTRRKSLSRDERLREAAEHLSTLRSDIASAEAAGDAYLSQIADTPERDKKGSSQELDEIYDQASKYYKQINNKGDQINEIEKRILQ